jgi:hypothetical protein
MGLGFSAEDTIEEDRTSLAEFLSPRGRTLLAYEEGTPVGVASLRELGGTAGEVKRMYAGLNIAAAASVKLF